MMKKKFLTSVLICLIAVISFMGCGTNSTSTYTDDTVNEVEKETLYDGEFVVIKKMESESSGNSNKLYKVYATDTKVMYYLWEGFYDETFEIEPIYNTDGTVMVYE